MINNDVLHGSDDWLFLYNGSQKQFDYLTGELLVGSESIQNFSTNINERFYFCKNRNIKYQHLVFPCKPVVKRELLPEAHNNIESIYLKYYAREVGCEANILYPLDDLRKVDSIHSTFHKYDTHNSSLGYLEVVKCSLNSLGFLFDFNDYISEIKIKKVGGDLAQMCSYSMKSDEEHLSLKNQDSVYTVGNREFLPSNTNDVFIVHNKKSISKKRLLVFGDSFVKGALRYYAIFFQEIFYIRSSFLHKDIADLYSPDVIITSNAERYLSNVKSDTSSRNFLLSLYGSTHYTPSSEYLNTFKACLSYKYHRSVYDEWVNSLDHYLENYEFNKIVEKITDKSEAADILRECAIAFEKSGDYSSAKALMEKAHSLRPKGIFIKRKLDSYNSKI